MSMQQEVKRILRLLGKHDELIIKAYLETDYELSESLEHEKAINELVASNIAWRPDDDHPVRLGNAIVTLLNHGTRSVHRAHIDADIGGRMNELEGLVDSYKAAKKAGFYGDAKVQLRSIREHVHDLSEMLKNTTRQLWRKIESEFGYVTSLEMKSNENQRVLGQVKRLNQSLELINRAELNRLAGGDGELRRWLTNLLPKSVESCLTELNDALHRLNAMLFEFKQLQTRGRIVHDFYSHYLKNPGFIPRDFTETVNIASVFNQVSGINIVGYGDLDATHQEPMLTEMLKGVRKKPAPIEVAEFEKLTVSNEPDEVIEAEVSFLKVKVKEFFSMVIVNGGLGVMSTYPSVKHDCEAGIWLHAIQEGYNTMSDGDKKVFLLKYDETQDPIFSGRHFVRDIEVICRV